MENKIARTAAHESRGGRLPMGQRKSSGHSKNLCLFGNTKVALLTHGYGMMLILVADDAPRTSPIGTGNLGISPEAGQAQAANSHCIH